jgi:hypothetical protein
MTSWKTPFTRESSVLPREVPREQRKVDKKNSGVKGPKYKKEKKALH